MSWKKMGGRMVEWSMNNIWLCAFFYCTIHSNLIEQIVLDNNVLTQYKKTLFVEYIMCADKEHIYCLFDKTIFRYTTDCKPKIVMQKNVLYISDQKIISIFNIGKFIVFGEQNGQIGFLNKLTGAVIKTRILNGLLLNSPLILHLPENTTDKICVVLSNGNIACINIETGAIIWHIKAKHSAYSRVLCTPIVVGNIVYCITEDNKLSCIDIRNGIIISQYNMEHQCQINTFMIDNMVYFSTNKHLYTLNLQTNQFAQSDLQSTFSCADDHNIYYVDSTYQNIDSYSEKKTIYTESDKANKIIKIMVLKKKLLIIGACKNILLDLKDKTIIELPKSLSVVCDDISQKIYLLTKANTLQVYKI